MNSWTLIRRSLRHFWAIHLSMALAVAVTTAVITGALTVGDSMRGSLKGLVLKRLGPIDQVMTTQSFFHQSTFDSWISNSAVQDSFPNSAPAIFFPSATIEFQPGQDSSDTEEDSNGGIPTWTSVSVWGTNKQFWKLDWNEDESSKDKELGRQEVVLNQAAAKLLKLDKQDIGKRVSLRIGKPSDVPAESFISTKDDRVQSIARLKLVDIIPNRGLGKLSLFPTVEDQALVFVSCETLQRVIPRAIRQSRDSGLLFNSILLAVKKPDRSSFSTLVSEEKTQKTIAALQPQLEDAGFRLKKSTIKQSFKDGADDKVVLEYWNLTSSRMMLDPGQLQLAQKALEGKETQPVLTYLANEIALSPNQDQEVSKEVAFFPVEKNSDENKSEAAPKKQDAIPFSMVSASDFSQPFSMESAGDTSQPFSPTSAARKPLPMLEGNQIILNSWAAKDLGATVGQWVRLKFYEPVSVDGDEKEFFADFKIAGISGLEKPSRQFRRRGRSVIPAVFYNLPFSGNDPDLTPEVPGVTDAASISSWDLPFETADKIRPQDDDYWKWYRTTPKAFISSRAGHTLWASRFGSVTGIRIPVSEVSEQELRSLLLKQIKADPLAAGIRFQAVKRDGLAASSGSTPFDVLFLMLSMFVVLSALILLSLFFRLGLQYRSDQLGLLFALGFDRKKVSSLWLKESFPSIVVGAAVGIGIGLLYAMMIIRLMRTSWVGAVTTVFLETHWTVLGCSAGFLSGIVISFIVIRISIWRYSLSSASGLVKGGQTDLQMSTNSKSLFAAWHVIALLVAGFGIGVLGVFLAGDAQAGSFLTAGFLALAAALIAVYLRLKDSSAVRSSLASVTQVSRLNLGRNPGRTMTGVSLIGISVFLIVSVSAFRLAPSDRGTAGCSYVIQTDIGIQQNLNLLSAESEQEPDQDPAGKTSDNQSLSDLGLEFYGFRLHDGQQAGCNNPYRSHLPQVLGVPEKFIQRFDSDKNLKFAWLSSSASTTEEVQNPWNLISTDSKGQGGESGKEVIDVVLDKNTAWYSLKVYLVGTEFEVEFPDAGKRKFRLVGLLDNSLLQGTLLISDTDYQRLFPQDDGQKFFLAWTKKTKESEQALTDLGLRFKDHGWSRKSSEAHLAQFLAVQNTYLNAFQSLGALGLLLGTFGLMIAQYRSLLERTREFAVFLALGFTKNQIRKMLTAETLWLLVIGFGVGLVGSSFCVFPHLVGGTASLPLVEIGLVLAAITALGIIVGILLVRVLMSGRLVELLRAK